MIEQIIRRYILDLLSFGAQTGSQGIRREIVESFWDLQYLYRFGIPEIPSPLPPKGPETDPNPADQIYLRDDLIFELTNAMLDVGNVRPRRGDPSPQPSLISKLGQTEFRIAGAKKLAERLSKAQALLSEEIIRLENTSNQ